MPTHAKMMWNPSDMAIWDRAAIKSFMSVPGAKGSGNVAAEEDFSEPARALCPTLRKFSAVRHANIAFEALRPGGRIEYRLNEKAETMKNNSDIEELWDQAKATTRVFDPAMVAHLQPEVRRFLLAVIEPGAPLAQAVRLKMTGEIKLKEWMPFEAEQVTVWDRGFIWKATAKMAPWVPIKGFDSFVDGEGMMRWKVFGLIPVMHADGVDISRSASGRMEVEVAWLPTALISEDVTWTVRHGSIFAHLRVPGYDADVEFRTDEFGELQFIGINRWGDADGDGEFEATQFGGFVLENKTFGGITVPTMIQVGWNPDAVGFTGEFFRCTIESVEFK